MIPSKISFPKFGLRAGFNVPGGIINCNSLRIANKSSGNPAGNGSVEMGGVANGTPNGGIAGPDGPEGDGNDTSFAEHGDIVYLYIQVIRIPLFNCFILF
jgi:hypothetical protein